MKPRLDKTSIFSMVFILCLISVPGFYAYFFTDWRGSSFLRDADQRAVIPEFQEHSKVFDRRIVLKKDKSITVQKNRLVFKGLKGKTILLDVFLLELDPEFAYPRSISKADAREGFRVGESRYRLLKVNRKTLQLKILDIRRS